jgi:hypothetical protein
MKSWASTSTNKPITNITHSNGLISFSFMSGSNYTITATCGANGTISPSGSTTLFEGSSQAYTITPNTHFERDEVLINEINNPTAVSSGTYTFTNLYSDQTIHATFKPKTYTVTFNANTGSGTMEKQNIIYGEPQKLAPNAFTKPNHIFVEWNTQTGGAGTGYTDGQVVSLTANITLYAQWEETVGIDEWADSPLHIVPNPASNYIDVRFEMCDMRYENIEFYNTFGQLVKSVSFNVEVKNNMATQQISITDLSKGLYLIKVGNKTAKLIVQ